MHQRTGLAVRLADFDGRGDFGFQHRVSGFNQLFNQLPRQVSLFLVLIDDNPFDLLVKVMISLGLNYRIRRKFMYMSINFTVIWRIICLNSLLKQLNL